MRTAADSLAGREFWRPTPDRVASTNLDRFRRGVNERHGLTLLNFADLHQWSVHDPEAFWSDAWDHLGMLGERGAKVLSSGGAMRSTRFFPESRLNVTEVLLHGLGAGDEVPAIVFEGESGVQRTWSRAELRDQVGRVQRALVRDGFESGDRLAAWMPNIPETVAAMLGTASLGGVFTSTSPDFGRDGVLDRFGQTEPRVLIAADAYWYNGRRHDCLDRLREIVDQLPSVERVVVVPYGDEEVRLPEGMVLWDDWIDDKPGGPVFEHFPFDYPWYVLYSSGTTGKPKCIVHRTGGVLLKHLLEHQLHSDVQVGDRAFYFTTAGWMMWNWLVSALGSGATLLLYDGSPFHPGPERLLDLADRHQATLFGISAKFLEGIAKEGLVPRESHSLASIRTIVSTGSPLAAEGFAYVYDQVKTDVHLASISGGTDLCGCLVAGDPTGPVHAGEIQVPALGLDIDVVSADGEPIGPGERGELICRSAFPSMPLRFWDDPGNQAYQAAYFERFSECWHQGDFAEWTSQGGMVIHGRSDATLNPGGVRIGTAEIYRQVDQIPEVVESIAIGQQWNDDTRVVLFVRLVEGQVLDDDLTDRIRAQIRHGASPRHVPAVIAAVPSIPRTRSGKLVELAVREVVHDRPVLNREAIDDPTALEHFRDHPALRA